MKITVTRNQSIANGVVHTVPKDVKNTLALSKDLLNIWNSLTPISRNEWICWIITVKKQETRDKHIERMKSDLLKGKRRPCCWSGCPHRVRG